MRILLRIWSSIFGFFACLDNGEYYIDKGKNVKAQVKNFDVNGVVNSILLKIIITE